MSDDPTAQANARVRAAADQFGAAIGDAFKLSLRRALARQIVEDYGPGPWLLYEDGRVEPVTPPRPRRQTKKDQT